MVLSYFAGKKYYPLPYPLKRICCYVVAAGVLYVGGMLMESMFSQWVVYVLRALLLILYVGIIARFEDVPMLSRIVRKFI